MPENLNEAPSPELGEEEAKQWVERIQQRLETSKYPKLLRKTGKDASTGLPLLQFALLSMQKEGDDEGRVDTLILTFSKRGMRVSFGHQRVGDEEGGQQTHSYGKEWEWAGCGVGAGAVRYLMISRPGEPQLWVEPEEAPSLLEDLLYELQQFLDSVEMEGALTSPVFQQIQETKEAAWKSTLDEFNEPHDPEFPEQVLIFVNTLIDRLAELSPDQNKFFLSPELLALLPEKYFTSKDARYGWDYLMRSKMFTGLLKKKCPHLATLNGELTRSARKNGLNVEVVHLTYDLDTPLPAGTALEVAVDEGSWSSGKQNLRGWTSKGARAANEDGFLINEERGVVALADGLGGAAHGEVGSEMALRTIALNPHIDLSHKVLIHTAEDGISKKVPKGTGPSTLVVARLLEKNKQESTIQVGWVGDSKALLIDPMNKRVLKHTTDQCALTERLKAKEERKHLGSFLDTLHGRHIEGDKSLFLDSGELTELGVDALYFLEREGQVKAIGGRNETYLEVEEWVCPKGSILLLLSDGITGVMSEFEIMETFSAHPFDEACEIVKREALDRQMKGEYLAQRIVKTPIGRSANGEAISVYPLPVMDNTTFVAQQL